MTRQEKAGAFLDAVAVVSGLRQAGRDVILLTRFSGEIEIDIDGHADGDMTSFFIHNRIDIICAGGRPEAPDFEHYSAPRTAGTFGEFMVMFLDDDKGPISIEEARKVLVTHRQSQPTVH